MKRRPKRKAKRAAPAVINAAQGSGGQHGSETDSKESPAVEHCPAAAPIPDPEPTGWDLVQEQDDSELDRVQCEVCFTSARQMLRDLRGCDCPFRAHAMALNATINARKNP